MAKVKRRKVGAVSSPSMDVSRKRWIEGKDPVELARLQCRSRALRGKERGIEADKRVWGISLDDYRSLVGRCFYCGSESLGLVRKDLSGRWEVSNALCCCGPCGRMRTGLSHDAFVSHIRLIASNNS